MAFGDVFGVFSNRSKKEPPKKSVRPLTREFRNRVLMLLVEKFQGTSFWSDVHKKFAFQLGRPMLTDAAPRGESEDIWKFINECADEHFLDFIEHAFRTDAGFHYGRNELVESINEFLAYDQLPYTLTAEVWTHSEDGRSSRLTALPQVIRRDSEMLHTNAIAPALQLFQRAELVNANGEFLAAEQHYRHGQYGDCLTKCGSALESVLKVVCKAKGWKASESDTMAALVKTVIGNCGIEGFFEKPLLQVAMMRNELSTAHGAGVRPRDVSAAKALYALNSTAAAALLVVAESGL